MYSNEAAAFKKAYMSGEPVATIASRFGICAKTVYGRVRKLGLHRKAGKTEWMPKVVREFTVSYMPTATVATLLDLRNDQCHFVVDGGGYCGRKVFKKSFCVNCFKKCYVDKGGQC